MNKMPKSDQINFIESQTEGDPIKLNAMRDDLDVFLLDLESWEGARKYLNLITQKYNPDFDAIDEINDFSDLLNEKIKLCTSEKKGSNTNKQFENIEWIKEKVPELESKGLSQNKALEKTKELYEEEFELKSPGKTTILRYLGRAE